MLRQQVFGTMLLLLGIFAVTDERNMSPPKGLIPFVVGLIIFLIGLSFAWNCGYALNPARDLSPRLFTAIAGWGSKTFRYRYHRRRHSHQLLYVCIQHSYVRVYKYVAVADVCTFACMYVTMCACVHRGLGLTFGTVHHYLSVNYLARIYVLKKLHVITCFNNIITSMLIISISFSQGLLVQLELLTFSSPHHHFQIPVTHQHMHPPHLSITHLAFHQNFKLSPLQELIPRSFVFPPSPQGTPALTVTSSNPLATRFVPPLVNKLMPSIYLSISALETRRLRLRIFVSMGVATFINMIAFYVLLTGNLN